MTRVSDTFDAARARLTSWLFDQALPLWSTVGIDEKSGGFFEKISRSGEAIEEPRRTRVVGRQIYAFATASRIGWQGPSRRIVGHGLDYLRRHCLTSNGSVVSVTRPDGTILNSRFDLYDHAFALFGLVAAAGIEGDAAELARIAQRIRRRMKEGWGHPIGGFEEGVPRVLPLLANPHMHMLEASLAWVENNAVADDGGWRILADEIANLCMQKFLHPQNGCLREFFDGDWSPMPGEKGRIVEPGHQFEWAWLLFRWGRLSGRADAIDAARRLVAIAEEHGVDELRGITFNEIWDDFSPKDRRSRLWQQTERIKAWLALASAARNEMEREQAIEKAALASEGLKRYLVADIPGSWNERMLEDASFVDEPAPASSLYHIVCAIAEMHKLT